MLTGFTASLLLITISELGDKTFFIAVILAMRHPHRLVFSAVMAALALMTVLSVGLGRALALFPKTHTHYGAIALFLIFGIKLIYDALRMSAKSADEFDSAVVKEAEASVKAQESSKVLYHYPQFGLWLQAFTMTFLAEWGDRTQISTIALAASNNLVAVTIGAILGHGICTIVAVYSGRLIAGKISERMITGIGGLLFLVFGATTYLEGV